MSAESLALFEYGEILMGKKSGFDVTFRGSLEDKRRTAGVIWRYAIEKILGWSPEQAAIYMNDELIKTLRLDTTFGYMDYGTNDNIYFDIRFVLQYAFPEKIKYSLEDDAKNEYERIMKLGKWENDTEKHQFHKNYFKGPDGERRAAVVLNCAINSFLPDVTNLELYEFFADRGSANVWLKKNEIESGKKNLYNTPLEYLHYALPPERSNSVYFLNAWLKADFEKTNQSVKAK